MHKLVPHCYNRMIMGKGVSHYFSLSGHILLLKQSSVFSIISHYESIVSDPGSPSVGTLEIQSDIENAIHMQLFQELTQCMVHLGKLSLSTPCVRISVSKAKCGDYMCAFMTWQFEVGKGQREAHKVLSRSITARFVSYRQVGWGKWECWKQKDLLGSFLLRPRSRNIPGTSSEAHWKPRAERKLCCSA